MYFGSIFVSTDFNLLEFLGSEKHPIFQRLEKLIGLKAEEVYFILHEIPNCFYVKGLDVHSNLSNLNTEQLKIQKYCAQNLHLLM